MSELTSETVKQSLTAIADRIIPESEWWAGWKEYLIVVDAAGRWANPDIEAGAKAAYEHVHGEHRWEDAEPLDRERFIGEATVTIAAALE